MLVVSRQPFNCRQTCNATFLSWTIGIDINGNQSHNQQKGVSWLKSSNRINASMESVCVYYVSYNVYHPLNSAFLALKLHLKGMINGFTQMLKKCYDRAASCSFRCDKSAFEFGSSLTINNRLSCLKLISVVNIFL